MIQPTSSSAGACKVLLFVHLLMVRPSSAQDCIQYQDYMFPIGSVEAPDARGVATSPGTVLVADGEWGLLVVDVTDPSAPEITAEVPVPGRPSAVAISGSYALVASYEAGLGVIELAPGPPHLVGLCSDPYFALDVAVVGDHAYVADPVHGVSVVDFATDPAAPIIVGQLLTPGQPTGIALGGNRAVVAMFDGGLTVLDLSDPQVPMLLGTADTEGFARDVALVGDHAYVADITRGLQVFDVSNPAQPQLVGAVDTPDLALGVTVDNGVAYVADWTSGLRPINVSNPAAPRPLGSIELPGAAQGVAVAADHAFLAQAGSGLSVVRIGNARSPSPIASIPTPGFTTGIDAEGTLAAIGYDQGFILADISDPKAPHVLSTLGGMGPAIEVLLHGDRACVIASTYVRFFDVVDPASPKDWWSTYTAAVDVAMEGNMAFFANGPSGVYVSDVEQRIYEVGLYRTFGDARGVAIQDHILYVADRGEGFIILDASDPTNLQLLWRLFFDDARAVAIGNQTAYVTDGHDGLVIVDVTNPKSPIRQGSAGAGFDVGKVQYDGGFVYVATRESGVAVFDVADPLSPVLVGFANTEDHVEDIAIGDGLILASGGTCHLFPKQCGTKLTSVANGLSTSVGLRVTPSPFVDTGEVRYALSEPGMARIAAYDATGRCRGVLLESWQAAGDGTVQWDGRGFGQRLPSGAYFIRLETSHGSRTQRITVVR